MTHIYSIEQLEVLLLMRETRAVWTAAGLSRQLGSSVESMTQRINDLMVLQAVAPSDGGHLYAADPALDEVIAELESEYRRRRLTVINFIYSKPSSTIRTLADAFRLRKKDD